MMESSANESSPTGLEENPFKDSESIVEDVEIHADENAAAEAARREEISQQLIKLEEEINTLRSALERKEKQHADLKRELGITPWSQLKDGIGSQITYIQNSDVLKKTSETLKGWNEKVVHSNAYTKTYSALSGAGEATSNAIKSAGAVTAKKIGELRESDTFKSFENKVTSATSSIKGKIAGSSFEADENVAMEGVDEVDPKLEQGTGTA